VRRQHQPLLQAGVGFGLEQIVHLAQAVQVRHFKIILAVFLLRLQIDIAVRAGGAPLDIAEIGHLLQRDGDALQPIGDLHCNRIDHNPASLLEIGELGDLLPVQPDFPAQTPGAERRRFPVIFDKADIVLARVDAQRFERLQVDLLRVAGVGFQDHLELVVHLQAVGVFAVAAVIRAHRGFHIAHIPGLGSQHAQEGGRVIGAGAYLGVIRLPDQAALARPVILQREHNRLKIERFFSYG